MECFHFQTFTGLHFCKKVCRSFFISGYLSVESIALETQRRQDPLLWVVEEARVY